MEKYIHDKKHLVKELLKWYDANARILPWRSNPTPYEVWVSEIMLQQTRVEAVKPYFERFIEKVPSIEALANTSDDELSKLWEGLGYYNRVRNMKKCAQYCVENYDNKLPASYEKLKELPGIGEYTAGAIASIAFKIPQPAVDGNVLRVFSRLLVNEEDILKEATKKKFQKIVKTYIPYDRCDAFTQAVMEIGATICIPNAVPRCNICPLASDCIGYQSGKAMMLPNKTKGKRRKIEKKTVLVVVCGNEVLLTQRPQQGLLANLYEFKVYDEYMKVKDIKKSFGENHIKKMMKLEDTKHIFSHIEWHMKGYLVVLDQKMDGLWCNAQEITEKYAIPTAYKKYKESLYVWWNIV